MTQKNLQFGIGIPQVFFDGKIDSKLISRFITRAEALDYHSLWVAERVFGLIPSVDPILSLTYAAALTKKIKIGTSILLSVLRHPVFRACVIFFSFSPLYILFTDVQPVWLILMVNSIVVLMIPVLTPALLKISNDKNLMGRYKNNWLTNCILTLLVLVAIYLTYENVSAFLN